MVVVAVVVSIVVKMVTSHSTVQNRRKVDPRLGSVVAVELVVVSNVVSRAIMTMVRVRVKEATKRSNSTMISVRGKAMREEEFPLVRVFSLSLFTFLRVFLEYRCCYWFFVVNKHHVFAMMFVGLFFHLNTTQRTQ